MADAFAAPGLQAFGGRLVRRGHRLVALNVLLNLRRGVLLAVGVAVRSGRRGRRGWAGPSGQGQGGAGEQGQQGAVGGFHGFHGVLAPVE